MIILDTRTQPGHQHHRDINTTRTQLLPLVSQSPPFQLDQQALMTPQLLQQHHPRPTLPSLHQIHGRRIQHFRTHPLHLLLHFLRSCRLLHTLSTLPEHIQTQTIIRRRYTAVAVSSALCLVALDRGCP